MKTYDLVIIGAGPAGLTACLYALRSSLTTLLVDKMQIGGGLAYIEKLENYPGFPSGVSGMELIDKISAQLKNYAFNYSEEEIKTLKADNGLWKIIGLEKEFSSKAVIIASGSIPKEAGVKGEEKFKGKGVSYCAVCDAPLFKEKTVVIIGGGNSALQEAIFVSEFAKNVIIVHRKDIFRADSILQKKAKDNAKIKFMLSSHLEEIIGKDFVEAVSIKNAKGDTEELNCQGVFVFAGVRPNTNFVKGVVKTDEEGYIITDEKLESSARGVFACGDCRKRVLRQVITACAEGAISAYSSRNFVENFGLGR